MKSHSNKKPYITGSKKTDIIAFIVLVCLILVTSYGIRAYYQVTVAEVKLVRVNPDGKVIGIPTKNIVRLFGLASSPPKVIWKSLDYITESYVKNYLKSNTVEPGTQFNWTITYSHNSTVFEDRRIISFEIGKDQDVRKKI